MRDFPPFDIVPHGYTEHERLNEYDIHSVKHQSLDAPAHATCHRKDERDTSLVTKQVCTGYN
jgi:hypothetical protein